MDFLEFIKKVQAGDKKIVTSVYSEYKLEFIRWFQHSYHCNDEMSSEIFQHAVIVLYDNIIDNKILEVKSSLKTYLFGIGKNLWREELRKKSKVQYLDIYSSDFAEDNSDSILKNITEDQLIFVAEKLKKIGEKCRNLLSMFYFEKMNLDQIFEVTDYKNKNSLKNQKHKCLNKLKELCSDGFRRNE